MHTKVFIISTTLVFATNPCSCEAKTCAQYSSMPYPGIYCPGDGIVTRHPLRHHCRYMCIQLNDCKAYNYNATDGTCLGFTSPCAEALDDPIMEYMVFREKPADQCYEWVQYNSGDAIDQRIIYIRANMVMSRIQRAGQENVGYLVESHRNCYAVWLGSEFDSRSGYPCQLLRIKEGCTIFWVPYIARDPIPPRAVVAGQTANGDRVFVTKFNFRSGHYVEGAADSISPYLGHFLHSNIMMVMVVL